MDLKMFATVPKERRLQMLSDNCEVMETKTYFHQATNAQLIEARELITEKAIKLNALAKEKKELLEVHKGKVSPIKVDYDQNLEFVRLKGEEKTEDLYKFIDRESNMVGYYNGAGVLVDERRCRPEELQTTIKMVNNF